MKRSFRLALLTLMAAITLSYAAPSTPARTAAPDEEFSVKEYEHFHMVLRPLQHEALPKNDYKTIRARMNDLLTLGEAIINLGVPEGVEDKNADEFKVRLKKFSEALGKFKNGAKSSPDDELRAAYLAVHDTFEQLAELLPKK